MSKRAQLLLLVSGGIDSTAMIDFYLHRSPSVLLVHFQYGQPSSQSERVAVERISDYYHQKSNIVKLDFPMVERGEELIYRNLLFVLAACSMNPPPLRIALGIHVSSLYYDSTKSFLDDCQRVLDGYFAGSVLVEAPFISITKRDVMEYCKSHNVPLQLTYSCLRQNNPPCGECSSCLDRKRLLGS